MKVSKAAAIWIDYHNTHSKKNTVRSYQSIIERFCQDFGDAEIGQVTPDGVFSFLGYALAALSGLSECVFSRQPAEGPGSCFSTDILQDRLTTFDEILA